jgi:hypothetical protein
MSLHCRTIGSVQEMLEGYLAYVATRWGAVTVEHLGGRRYIARRQDGGKLRLLAPPKRICITWDEEQDEEQDQEIGIVQGDERFEELWRQAGVERDL